MKINNIDVLVTKVEAKKNKDGGDYIAIAFLDLGSGDNFQVISKNIEYMRLRQMTKYNVTLELSNSRFGLKLDLEEVGEELGTI